MVHKIKFGVENGLTFWDEKGNPLLSIVSTDERVDSEDLNKLHPSIVRFLKKYDIKVDNSSEEFLRVEERE